MMLELLLFSFTFVCLCSPCIIMIMLYITGISVIIRWLYNKSLPYMAHFIPEVNLPPAGEPLNVQCPVCHEQPVLPVQTNCNHKHCSRCFIQWWQSSENSRAVAKCPLCRSSVSYLLIQYGQTSDTLSLEGRQVLGHVHEYNRRYSQNINNHSWTQFYLQDTVTILPHIYSFFSQLPQEVRRTVIMYAVAAGIYIISPLDLLPEAMLGPIGLGDDAAIIAFAVRGILLSLVQSLQRQGEEYINQ